MQLYCNNPVERQVVSETQTPNLTNNLTSIPGKKGTARCNPKRSGFHLQFAFLGRRIHRLQQVSGSFSFRFFFSTKRCLVCFSFWLLMVYFSGFLLWLSFFCKVNKPWKRKPNSWNAVEKSLIYCIVAGMTKCRQGCFDRCCCGQLAIMADAIKNHARVLLSFCHVCLIFIIRFAWSFVILKALLNN